jgi:hypothetical protein
VRPLTETDASVPFVAIEVAVLNTELHLMFGEFKQRFSLNCRQIQCLDEDAQISAQLSAP